MTDDETQLDPGSPEERVDVQGADKCLHSLLFLLEGLQSHAVEITVEVIKLSFFKVFRVNVFDVFGILVDWKVFAEFVVL
jgi:hypothetical protein